MGEEREVLKHQADAALLRRNEIVRPRHLLAVEQHLARGWALDAGGDPEQRGLAAAGGTKQAEHLARRHVERDMVERKALAITLGDIGEDEFGSEGNARPAPLMALVRAPFVSVGEELKHRGCLRCSRAPTQLPAFLSFPREVRLRPRPPSEARPPAGSSSSRKAAASSGLGMANPGGRLESRSPAPFSSERPGRSWIESKPKWPRNCSVVP